MVRWFGMSLNVWSVTGQRYAGYTAEAMAEAGLSHLVALGADGRPASVNYDRIAAYLAPIIKDHDRQIADLERRLDALETA